LNSVVCISHVPDTESKITIAPDGTRIEESGLKFIVSPYDELALEEAVGLKEAEGGDVTVVTFGPDRAAQALRECLARGATKAVHVKGEVSGADSLGIAKVLAAVIREIGPDLVFAGKQGVGTDNSLVGPMLAELLDLPQLNVVTKLEKKDERLVAHREIEGAEEIVEAPIPAVVTAQKGLNEPRYSSLKGIMAAKKIPIDVKSISDLGLSDDDVYGKRVRVIRFDPPAEKSGGRKIEVTDPKSAAEEILAFIREEVKAL
jgi:electron transfer flavoprotein beta subunit